MFDLANTAELAEAKYTAFKLDTSKRSVLSLQIRRKDNSTLFFPYSHAVLTEAEHQEENNYSMVLLGGGKTVILHLKAFNDAIYSEFCDAFADHKIRYIYELPDNSKNVEEPHFKIEVLDMNPRI